MQVKCSHFGKITSSTNRLSEITLRTAKAAPVRGGKKEHQNVTIQNSKKHAGPSFLLVFSRSEDGDVAPDAALKNGLGCSAE